MSALAEQTARKPYVGPLVYTLPDWAPGQPITTGDRRRLPSGVVARWIGAASSVVENVFNAANWQVWPADNGTLTYDMLYSSIRVRGGVTVLRNGAIYEAVGDIAIAAISQFEPTQWARVNSGANLGVAEALYAYLRALDPSGTKYRWTPPTQTDPLVVRPTLTTTFNGTYDNTQDVILDQRALTARRSGPTNIGGGRIVKVIGGTVSSRIRVVGCAKAVIFEGVHFDYTGNTEPGDAANAYGRFADDPKAGGREMLPDVYFLGCKFTGLLGAQNLTHGDMFQPQGPIGTVYADLITGSSQYQGFFLNPQYTVKGAFLSRMNLVGYDDGTGLRSAYLLWLSTTKGRMFPTFIDEVYLGTPELAKNMNSLVWPKAGERLFQPNDTPTSGAVIGAVIDTDGSAFWDNGAFFGRVKPGPPPGGDFVDANVGIGYVERGYLSLNGPQGVPGVRGDKGDTGLRGPQGQPGSSDADALGLCWTVDPQRPMAASAPGAGVGVACRVRGRRPASTQARLVVAATTSGSITMALYANNTQTGRAAAPGARKTTTGPVPAPAVGATTIGWPAPVDVDPDDWWYIGTPDSTFKLFGVTAPDPSTLVGLAAKQTYQGTVARDPLDSLIPHGVSFFAELE